MPKINRPPKPKPQSVSFFLGADDIEKQRRIDRLDTLAHELGLGNRSELVRALADGGRVENGKLVLDRPAAEKQAS